MVMGDKADYNVNVEALAAVDAGVLAALRVGQRLKLQPSDSESPPKICSEEGLELAPLADPKLAARFYNPKVMVKSIKRDPASGSILQLQVRLYRNSNAGPPHVSGANGVHYGAGSAAGGAGGGGAAGEEAAEQSEYVLRRAQYEALASRPELKAMLANTRLQDVLTRIDGAPDREQALAVQLGNPEFQGFVTQVLACLDPNQVSATAAAVAAGNPVL